MNILFRLLIAHLLGDFVLHPKSWVDERARLRFRSPRLYAHVAVHFALIMVLVCDIHFWWGAVIICASHLVFDIIKSYLGKGKIWFFIDQLLHILVIIGVWYIYVHPVVYIPYFNEEKCLIVILALLFVTKPAGIIVKIIISKWETNINPNTTVASISIANITQQDKEALEEAGLYIGIMERFLVVVFILLNQWAAIGFLLASKSVFRFGDLRQANDRKLTEYILIGTLLSFGIAILVGVITNCILNYY